MGVQKFVTFPDAEKALFEFNPDNAYYQRVAELWRTARYLSPPQKIKRGLVLFKTLEEMQESKNREKNMSLMNNE